MATIGIWNPDVHGPNITSTTLFPLGSQFLVRVNVTSAGPIVGFDVFLNYNLTFGPSVIQAVKTGDEFAGGLFDPSTQPSGCSTLVVRNEINIPPERIRVAAVLAGGCTANGIGTLFTIRFRVIAKGASLINIVRTSAQGERATTLVGLGGSIVAFDPIDGRFQNIPGVAPAAQFLYSPVYPVKGDAVHFDASSSYDPANSTSPGRGIRRYLWLLGDGTLSEGINQTHIFMFPILIPASGNFSVILIVWNFLSLPGTITQVVAVSPGIGQAASFNWSGYAVTSAPGTVTDVKASWIVPTIIGSCGPVDQYSSFWVGIDGLNSPTVEQTGTDSACVGGARSYYAWYELYPQPSHVIKKIKVHPGDTIFAEVSYSSGKFNITIADLTTHKRFTKITIVSSAQRSSAEWIAEAPSSTTGILPLANFGLVRFGGDYTGIANSCYATISGARGPLGSFGARAREITMIRRDLTIKAMPSPLSADLTSFTVAWADAGP